MGKWVISGEMCVCRGGGGNTCVCGEEEEWGEGEGGTY